MQEDMAKRRQLRKRLQYEPVSGVIIKLGNPLSKTFHVIGNKMNSSEFCLTLHKKMASDIGADEHVVFSLCLRSGTVAVLCTPMT